MAGAAALMGGHELIVPIVLPLVAGAMLLLLERAGSAWVRPFSLLATALLALLSAALLLQAEQGEVQVYLLSNWQAPWGIALALDRLSALMLLLTALVACAALLYAVAGDDLQGSRGQGHFHALFQFQLMGLNGAFLTADLFNLFVFFEVLLAASYGLLLHGANRPRLKAGLHYVVFNLTGSALFLVAVSLLYALTGTLNMADLAVKLALLGPEDQRLAQAAALLLMLVFAVKAALLPLYFWLPDAYASASAPTAALFAIMTKVGVYAILRMSTLVFGAAGLLPTEPVLAWVALATLALAAVGALAAQRLRGLVAYLVVGSAGTLLLAVGLNTTASVAAGLFYLVPSTLVAAAWFLLADRIAWARGGSDLLQARQRVQGWAPLGLGFLVAAVAAAGVPPLAAFMGKAMLLKAAGQTPLAAAAVSLVLVSSLALMVALARAGSTLFWEAAGTAPDRPAPPTVAAVTTAAATLPTKLPTTAPATVRAAVQAAPAAVTLMLAAVLCCAIWAGPLERYALATASQLKAPQAYVQAVLGARPVPPVHDLRREMRERGERGENP